jgi:hypothetical protein
MDNHSHEMDTLKKAIDVLEDFFMEDAVEIDPNLSNISGGKYVSRRRLSIKARRALDLANVDNTLLEMIINLWFELGEARRNLIIGNYGSVHRSLRWILESGVFWTYLQIDKEQNAKKLFEDHLEDSIDKKRYEYLTEHLFDVNQIIFDKHLHIKEKFGKPSIKEMINSLEFYKKKNNKTKDDHNPNKTIGYIISELSGLYHDFSALVHISLNSLDETEDIGKEYPSFMGYSYNDDKFKAASEKIWRIVDLMTSIFILTCSCFYVYDKPFDYLAQLKKFNYNKKYHHTRKFFNLIKTQNQMSITKTLLEGLI